MPGHHWHPLHGDMPVRGMNEELEPPAVEGEMPTRPMEAATPAAHAQARAPDQKIEPELAAYLEQKEGGRRQRGGPPNASRQRKRRPDHG